MFMCGSRAARIAMVLPLLALLVPACHRAGSRPSVNAAAAHEFHRSDPRTIASTGKPQLLEFFGPT